MPCSWLYTAHLRFTPDLNAAIRCSLPQTQLNRLQRILNALARAAVAALTSSNPILKSLLSLKVQEYIGYKVMSTIYTSCSLMLHVICVISTQSSLLDPLDHPHCLPFSIHQLTPSWNFRYAAPQLWNKLPPALRVSYQFDPSSSPSSSPSSCSDPSPLVDPFVKFSILVLKLSFYSLSLPPSSGWSPGIMTTRCLAVTGEGSISNCGRLSQPSWLQCALWYSRTYLLTQKLLKHFR